MTNTPSFSFRGHTFTAPKLEAGLYLVSTPIGNLSDITIRALETLAGCDVIGCEDTRTSGVLLKRYGIDRPKVSYTEHNASTRGPDLLRQIEEGKAVALISDAGTPIVSDPGFRLAEQAVENELPVIPIPGASAPLAALVGSGLIAEDFRFCGFLPSKQQARLMRLDALKGEQTTLIFFEGPSRITATLDAMGQTFGENRKIVVARELTKMHETFHRGTAFTLMDEFEAMDKIRGEIVIVVAPGETHSQAVDVDQLLTEALETMKTKQAAASVAKISGHSKQELYSRALALKAQDPSD